MSPLVRVHVDLLLPHVHQDLFLKSDCRYETGKPHIGRRPRKVRMMLNLAHRAPSVTPLQILHIWTMSDLRQSGLFVVIHLVFAPREPALWSWPPRDLICLFTLRCFFFSHHVLCLCSFDSFYEIWLRSPSFIIRQPAWTGPLPSTYYCVIGTLRYVCTLASLHVFPSGFFFLTI